MRIISGQWRGRKLCLPTQPIDGTRPTMDRTREAVFSILRARQGFERMRVIDVFAGTGAYGFEALSQGAAHVTFFEQAATAAQSIKESIAQFQCNGQTRVILGDVLAAPKCADSAVDLAFFDPPYAQGAALLPQTLHHLHKAGWLDADTLLVIETASRNTPALDDVIVPQDQRRYGASQVIFGLLKTA